ncbi:hypothetical protein GWE18_28155 [Bradyrhizobium sp. CSA112]|uniref:hypothetical protein n=1 Tax=Bradyrhizobium sp. CSA112 TaxID=2699170 RepID=UPI0023B09EE9|nr:hypothetical protein [Bradyrhizobium sp. CSA112]MDE5456632.1 hypothetical protein [Bradyrhizobium sp. CSA112]
MVPDFPLPQPRGPGAGVKQAMCHSGGSSLLFAILAALSILNCAAAGAQTGTIEQNFAASGEIAESTAGALMFSGVGGHYAFISQGRPTRISKN